MTANQTAGDTIAIQADQIVRRFGEMEALSRVSLKIRKGEFFSLLGPSGCGKTTLLRIIAGLDFPDEGTLQIGGRDAASVPAHKRPVNTVFQSYALFPHLSVRDNVAFGLRMKKIAAGEIRERVDKIMTLVQITPFADRKPAQLSGGQKQRVALARALVNEPEVLLLDEPLGALDLKLRKELQVELSQLQRRLGITFILVTHDQEEALVMSDRIAVMNAGKIEQLDGVEEIYERPRSRFVAKFLGSCNLLDATVTKIENGTALASSQIGELSFDLSSARQQITSGTKLTLAIRPEKIRLYPASKSPAENQFVGRIEDLIYCGAETQYRLSIGGETLNASVMNAEARSSGFEIGQSAMVHLPANALIVLDN